MSDSSTKAVTCTRWVEVWLAEPKAHLSSGAWHSLPWYPSCPQLFLGSPFRSTICCLFNPRSLTGCRHKRYWEDEIPAPLLLSLLLCSFPAQLSCPSSTGLILNFCTKFGGEKIAHLLTWRFLWLGFCTWGLLQGIWWPRCSCSTQNNIDLRKFYFMQQFKQMQGMLDKTRVAELVMGDNIH